MKRVLFLGASSVQVPAIRYARDQGHYVITTDYLPENPGHALAHERHDVSTTDQDAVLALADASKIDGIVAYASEPAAPTAAFVAEKLGLPANPYETVLTLSSKDRYRQFLARNGFACPRHLTCAFLEEARTLRGKLTLPVVLKPVDSSGSRGVTVLESWDGIEGALAHAMAFSRAKRAIAEEFIGEPGVQVLGEAFAWQGELLIACFARHRFDHRLNGLVPIGGDFPYGEPELEQRLRAELQRVITAVGLRMGPMNIEFRVGKDGRIHVMEVAARNGGNLLPQLVTHATGFDMVKNTVDVALGFDCDQPRSTTMNGFYSYCVLHADRDGTLRRLELSEMLRSRIVEANVWAKPGDRVSTFTGAHCSLGVLILQFETAQEMKAIMDAIPSYVEMEIE